MIPSKRSSLSSKQPSLSSLDLQAGLECERAEKYIQFIKLTLRTHLKNHQTIFQQNEIKEMYRLASNAQKNISKQLKDSQITILSLRQEFDKCKLQKDAEIAALKQQKQIQSRDMQSVFRQKMLAIQNEFGRKQQSYKEVIQRAVNNLSRAQKMFQTEQAKMQKQLNMATQGLKKAVALKKQQRAAVRSVKNIVGQIQLRKQNSLISPKEDQMSLDQIVIGAPPEEYHDSVCQQEAGPICAQKQLQLRLSQLICFGLFQPCNEQCIKKMLSLTASCQHPSQLLQSSLFPLMSQMLVSNMRKHQQSFLNHSDAQQKQIFSGVQLRNINNLSELSISDSHCQDLCFKRKQHI